MKKHLIIIIGIVLYFILTNIESPKIYASNKISYLDSLEYDSLDSVYLRQSDYTCVYLLDETGFFGAYHCSITSHKADSILSARKKILRSKKTK